jgi:hypothetical protein
MNIPVKLAKDISIKTNYPEIIILGYDPTSGQQGIATFG